jgi:hypothetical protein
MWLSILLDRRDHRQRKRSYEPAQGDTHRRLAAVQWHTTTLLATRMYGESAFTEEISSEQGVSNPRLVTNHRDHLSVPRR